jgi:hypothetical protein
VTPCTLIEGTVDHHQTSVAHEYRLTRFSKEFRSLIRRTRTVFGLSCSCTVVSEVQEEVPARDTLGKVHVEK